MVCATALPSILEAVMLAGDVLEKERTPATGEAW